MGLGARQRCLRPKGTHADVRVRKARRRYTELACLILLPGDNASPRPDDGSGAVLVATLGSPGCGTGPRGCVFVAPGLRTIGLISESPLPALCERTL